MFTDRRLHTELIGLGAYVPEKVVTNAHLKSYLDTSDEWIVKRTGIKERRRAAINQSAGDMAVEACESALVGINRSRIQMLILATTTPDFKCPATAPLVAARLGLGEIPAFDLSAVCSGFIYALSVASAIVGSGQFDTILVVATEKFSDLVDPNDRNTACLFGDGAGAVVIKASESTSYGTLKAIDIHADGSLSDLIIVETGGSRHPEPPSNDDELSEFLKLKGQDVFSCAVSRMSQSTKVAMDRAGWLSDDVDFFIGHQANKRILDAIRRKLGFPSTKVVMNLDKLGNTAGASIPLAMFEFREKIPTGSKVVLTSFGAGATWGSIALTWPKITSMKGTM